MLDKFKIHHLGMATYSIEKTSIQYIEWGFNMSEVFYDPIQKVNICFLTKINNPIIELIEPITDSSPISNMLNKSGVSPYHICYEVENIEESIAELHGNKFISILKPSKAIALENRLICFLYKKEIGLIELLQSSL